jgi:hypothetical protein
MAKNLFDIARENAKYKICDGCGERKSIEEFKSKNKYCTGCPKLDEIRETYRQKYLNTDKEIQSDIEDIDLDDFFKNM